MKVGNFNVVYATVSTRWRSARVKVGNFNADVAADLHLTSNQISGLLLILTSMQICI